MATMDWLDSLISEHFGGELTAGKQLEIRNALIAGVRKHVVPEQKLTGGHPCSVLAWNKKMGWNNCIAKMEENIDYLDPIKSWQ